MKLLVLSVYDSKAASYCPPFMVPRVEVGIRDFTNAVNDPSSALNMHPEDYTLFHIAEWDTQTGVYVPLQHHESFGLAASYLRGIKGENNA